MFPPVGSSYPGSLGLLGFDHKLLLTAGVAYHHLACLFYVFRFQVACSFQMPRLHATCSTATRGEMRSSVAKCQSRGILHRFQGCCGVARVPVIYNVYVSVVTKNFFTNNIFLDTRAYIRDCVVFKFASLQLTVWPMPFRTFNQNFFPERL
jgi:hypothetical protein